LGITADWAGEENMAKSMREARKIGKGILESQNKKEKRNKNMKGFLGY
jgi:hypothetical protein